MEIDLTNPKETIFLLNPGYWTFSKHAKISFINREDYCSSRVVWSSKSIKLDLKIIPISSSQVTRKNPQFIPGLATARELI